MILVTGGLGFVGSHVCVELLCNGLSVVALDNLSNAKTTVADRIRTVASGGLEFVHADVRDGAALRSVLSTFPIESVFHFAGLKSVRESFERPLDYYDTNVGGAVTLLAAMREHGVREMVFSSSATVYGIPRTLPVTEDHPLVPVSPYGRTKLIVEDLLADMAKGAPGFRYASLRYFNPVGAHPSGSIGEDPLQSPENLMPYVSQVAIGRRPRLRVFGNDYDTPDGTCVRDFIHVMDLAAGHLAALRFLRRSGRSITVNLGTGRGRSVMEVVRAFEHAAGKAIPLEIADRRPGDVPALYADATRAFAEFGWKAEHTLEEMCIDAWRWQQTNPPGYYDQAGGG